MGAAQLHAFEFTTAEIELEQLAREALARAKTATKVKSIRPGHPPSPTRLTKLPVRSFIFLWKDLNEWWLQYDSTEIAAELTDEHWEQFEATLAGTLAFAERLRSLRADTIPAVQDSWAGTPVR